MGINKTPQALLQSIRAHGLTQSEVADKTGIPQPTISKIERGAVGDVKSRNYLALLALHDELQASASTATESGEGTTVTTEGAGG